MGKGEKRKRRGMEGESLEKRRHVPGGRRESCCSTELRINMRDDRYKKKLIPSQ